MIAALAFLQQQCQANYGRDHAQTARQSQGENMSEIQSLMSRIDDLNRAVSFWNTLYFALVAGTVVLAGLVFFTQLVGMKRSAELSAAQVRLIALKDEQLARDLRAC
jgi:hypothetical protein